MEKLLNKLERRFGRYALRDVMFYVIVLMGCAFLLDFLMPEANVLSYIYFDRAKILSGEVWRVISFIALPPSSNIVYVALSLYFYYFIGSSLEKNWGSFRFGTFYLFGVIGSIIAGFITGYATAEFLNLSLFLAFAMIFPEEKILIFFVIPVKVKYLGVIDAVFLIILLLVSPLYEKVAIIFAFINVILFFFGDLKRNIELKTRYRKTQQNFRNAMRGR